MKKKDIRQEKGYLSQIIAVKNHFQRYCSQLTCLGFNSARLIYQIRISQCQPVNKKSHVPLPVRLQDIADILYGCH
uniref:Uncharacterized protein n=1 Tax=Romanomermis culicivorax TaxID=13658 RepID=A0A915IFF7_ROMCU